MQRKAIADDEAVQRYVLDHSERLEPHHLALIDATNERFGDLATYQVPPEQALLLRMITRIAAPRQALEIGTFTGLSAMLIAEGLPQGGTLTCLDINPETTALAREHWEKAGLDDRISLVIGPASETLARMAGEAFELVFIDADKGGYVEYLEAVLPMLGHGGLVVADNTLRSGSVADPDAEGETIDAIRRFNTHVASRNDIDAVMIPAYDGVTIIRKR